MPPLIKWEPWYSQIILLANNGIVPAVQSKPSLTGVAVEDASPLPPPLPLIPLISLLIHIKCAFVYLKLIFNHISFKWADTSHSSIPHFFLLKPFFCSKFSRLAKVWKPHIGELLERNCFIANRL